ncbi:hypothetical protein FHR25_005213 [Yokenella regensburgei]|nr:hypothetical protein FHR25_005213 [Yokenella regensburgei]
MTRSKSPRMRKPGKSGIPQRKPYSTAFVSAPVFSSTHCVLRLRSPISEDLSIIPVSRPKQATTALREAMTENMQLDEFITCTELEQSFPVKTTALLFMYPIWGSHRVAAIV